MLLVGLAAWPVTLLAQAVFTMTGGMPVRLEINVACLVSASDLDFGNYNPNQPAPAQGTATITLRCSPGITAEIALDGGTTPGSTRSRKMSQESGTDRLDYDLYQDPARAVPWGDRPGRDTLEVTTTGQVDTVTVYGAIPGGQRPRDGSYSDTIGVTLLY